MIDDLRELEPAAEWRAADVADPDAWTLRLTDEDHAELHEALRAMLDVSDDPLQLRREHVPLPGLRPRLEAFARELIEGRGFGRISALDVERYSDDELTLLYWGIGLHLGEPWPQNKYGHVLGDVTDQGKGMDDPTVRGNELGGIRLDYHTDGSDLVGLLCLRAAEGGRTVLRRQRRGHPQRAGRAPAPSWLPRSTTSCPRTPVASTSRAASRGSRPGPSPATTSGCGSA